MKPKARILLIAGQNERKQNLFAILDECGHTEYQVWAFEINMEKQYDLKTK